MRLFNVFNHTSDKKIHLYLHAGTHKTGTTAIQAFAAAHRKKLLRRGLLYPGYYPLVKKNQEAHHWFAHAIADTDDIPLSAESVPLLTNTWLKKARRKKAQVFVSAEALYRHLLGQGPYRERRLQYLTRVAQELDKFEVHAILVFRRPDDYIRSLYQERVMRSARPLPPFQKFSQKGQNGLNYHQNAKIFQQVFPKLSCFIYEDMNTAESFFTNFFEVMKIDVSDLNGVGVVRKSLSPAETMVKNFANGYLDTRRDSKAFLRWMRCPEVAARIKEYYGDRQYDLWPSHAVRGEFLESRQQDLEALRRKFFPSREVLFPPLSEGETVPPVPPLPEELKRMVREYFGR